MKRSRHAVVALVLCAGGCGSKTKKAEPVVPRSTAVPDVGISVEEIRQDLEATLLENYSHLSLGNVDAYNDSIATEGDLVLFGPRGSDLVDAPPVKRDRRVYRDANLRYLSKNLEVHVIERSRAAWITDEISLRIPHERREAAMTMRYSAVLERSYGRWLIRTEHLSVPIAADRATALGEKTALRFGRFIRDSSRGAPQAANIAARLHNADDLFRREHISGDAETHVWLPGPRGELRGDRVINDYRMSAYLDGDVRVQVAASAAGAVGDDLAWVAEQLRVSSAEVGELPVRVLSVFERKDGVWRLAHAHCSVPLTTDDMNALVFE